MSEAAKSRGNEEYKKRNYDEAIQYYSQTIELSPEESAYYGNRSAAYYILQRYEDALLDCQTGLKLQSTFIKLLMRAGKCDLALGNFEESKGYYQDALQQEPENDAVKKDAKLLESTVENEHMFKQCLKNEQYPQANYFLDQLLQVVTHNTSFKIKKLELLIEGQQASEALEYIRGLPEHEPGIMTLKGVAMYYIAANPSYQAKAILGEAIRMDPENIRATRMLQTINEMDRLKEEGNCYFKSGNSEEAIEAYSQALALDPKHKLFNATILANRAAAYMKRRHRPVIPAYNVQA